MIIARSFGGLINYKVSESNFFCFAGGRPDSPSGVSGAGYPGAAGPPTQNMYSSCKLQGPPSPPETKVHR